VLKFITPNWDAPSNIKAFVTTRIGGFSKPPYESFNLATHVGDDPEVVTKNRKLLGELLDLPAEPRWLNQVHGITVAEDGCLSECDADAFYTDKHEVIGVVMTADCLPVFIASNDGKEIAIAHAGWRGLLDGVIESSVEKFRAYPKDLNVWLGPAIGPAQFEVGDEVRIAFTEKQGTYAENAFVRVSNGKWLADIYLLARQRLSTLGVEHISGGQFCTVSQPEMFYSYRRDGITGRMASLIWIEKL
jgi:YfiH family protein